MRVDIHRNVTGQRDMYEAIETMFVVIESPRRIACNRRPCQGAGLRLPHDPTMAATIRMAASPGRRPARPRRVPGGRP